MIGQLRERVGLYRADETPDAQGGIVRDWRFDFAAWAGVAPLAPRQDAHSETVHRRYRFTLRYSLDVPSPARLRWKNRNYVVLAVSDPDLRGERLHLICEEI